MVVPMVLLKIAARWLFTFYRAAKKFRNYGFLHRNPSRLHQVSSLYSSVTKCSLEGREAQSIVCDFQGILLQSSSLFPYFMLVAFEGGSIFRAFLLLLSFPFLWTLGHHGDMSMRVMVFITFCGLRTRDMNLVARAVLPKFYLENLHLQAYEVLASTGRRVVLTSMPRVMVEGFLEEYLSVDEVVGTELQVVRGSYFTGLISGHVLSQKQKALRDLFGETKADVALLNPSNAHDHLFISHCKEAYVVSKEDPTKTTGGMSAVMPRNKYPKPLIFHDGRLAFFPTPLATMALFLYLPMGIALVIVRIVLGLILPYKAAMVVGALSGVRFRVDGLNPSTRNAETGGGKGKGVLYVCSHRTLLDPVMLSAALQRSVPAVTYSLSPLSEMMSPIKLVRLTRGRDRDAETMRRLLSEGDLAVCPEGTTCREPYLLRFSPLFAELADEIVPVAIDAKVSVFYGTTASGHKWLDPVLFFMNTMPEYRLRFMERVPGEMTCSGGQRTGAEVANWIQRRLAEALGFECTALTRRDKYMMLAGNPGVVRDRPERKSP
ncbi:glycerol-3-phosphate acyltransferase 1-like [Phoenix dactylifera]|uniref:Glycerol-3-phosphate acyltransferase 1-like n=1 Tax=Phoenix dactylifera TaxID=42345 RepID=A0A8B9AUE8_PHODC|nr:glycerol-3-phosphate acyltransferase 1-like [Phoenix dactylifera]